MLKIVTGLASIGLFGFGVAKGLGYFPFLEIKEVILILFLIIFFTILYQYGDDLMERLKKLGPMEFFEKKINEIYFDERFHPDPIVGRSFDSGEKIPMEEFFKYQISDLFINFLEFSNIDLMKLRNKDKILNIIRSVGTIAFYQQDYFRAISRFEKLRDLTGNSFDRSYNIGLSYLKLAEKEEVIDKRRSYFEKSLENFDFAKKLDKDDYDVYYHIAWVLDDLGRFEEAINNNKKCLDLKPEFDPARYNIAVSLTKMGKYNEAFKELQKITKNKEVWETAAIDKELEKLRTHGEIGEKVRELIATRLEDK